LGIEASDEGRGKGDRDLELVNSYVDRIKEAHPELDISELVLNKEGLVNDVLIISGVHVFRFPKSDWAIGHLRHEARCLDLARQYINNPIPDWTYYDGDFVSYQLIPGIALQRHHILALDERKQERLAEELGLFLRQLHTIPMKAVEAFDIAPSATVRTADDWLQLYEEVQRTLFPSLMEYAQTWVHNHFEPLVKDPGWMGCQPRFMNGDLGPYHLLFNPSAGTLNGIIDFGTAGVGDPAADIACLIDNYGETFVRRMVKTYPGIANLIDRARFWAGTLELQWALQGLRANDLSWLTVHIGRARDVMPVGAPLRP
jgi:aminoglycoside 2''-phosphotransferase